MGLNNSLPYEHDLLPSLLEKHFILGSIETDRDLGYSNLEEVCA
jgi:hypothetical protein